MLKWMFLCIAFFLMASIPLYFLTQFAEPVLGSGQEASSRSDIVVFIGIISTLYALFMATAITFENRK